MEFWANKASEFNKANTATATAKSNLHTYVNTQPTTGGEAHSDTIGSCANPPQQYGWICPKCGKVYSPWTSQCFCCGGGSWTITCNSGTGTPIINDSITIASAPKTYTCVGPAPTVTLKN